MHRRSFIQALLAAFAAPAPTLRVRADTTTGRSAAFLHGVASGDPTSDSVILWTRVSGYPAHARQVKVRWQVAEDAGMSRLVAGGIAETDADLAQLAKNPVILSGDMHTAMAAELSLPEAAQPVAAEFMAPSVTSPGITAALPERSPGALRDATLRQNPHMKYMDMHLRGWLCLTVTQERCSGEWHLLDGIRERDYESAVAKTLWVEAGRIGHGFRQPYTG